MKIILGCFCAVTWSAVVHKSITRLLKVKEGMQEILIVFVCIFVLFGNKYSSPTHLHHFSCWKGPKRSQKLDVWFPWHWSEGQIGYYPPDGIWTCHSPWCSEKPTLFHCWGNQFLYFWAKASLFAFIFLVSIDLMALLLKGAVTCVHVWIWVVGGRSLLEARTHSTVYFDRPSRLQIYFYHHSPNTGWLLGFVLSFWK